jgi:hypothetical protein
MRVLAALIVAVPRRLRRPGGSRLTSDSANLLGSYTGLLPCADCAGIRTDSAPLRRRGVPLRAERNVHRTRGGDRTIEARSRAK